MLVDIKRLALLTLSVPIKPGSVHRLMGDVDFERRLLEFVEVEPLIEEAHRRGHMLARGEITAQELGLGALISKALKAASEVSSEVPLVGLWSATLTMASMDGYAAASGLKVHDSLRVLMLRTLYASLPEDAVYLLEGVSDVGDTELLNQVSQRDMTENYVTSNKLSLGDLFEVLAEVDKGFSVNLRNYEWLLNLSRNYESSRSLVAGMTRAYLAIASELTGDPELTSMARRQELELSQLLKMDRRLASSRGLLNRSLGGVFLTAFLATSSGKAPRGI
ncbi:MAG: hypothetical protein ACP5HK_04290 [Acidilobus sp.]